MEALRIHGKRKSRAEFNCRLICKQQCGSSNLPVGSTFEYETGLSGQRRAEPYHQKYHQFFEISFVKRPRNRLSPIQVQPMTRVGSGPVCSINSGSLPTLIRTPARLRATPST